MPLNEKKIRKILKKYENDFFEMEHYDKTREKLWGRKRIDITLYGRVIKKLKDLSKKTKKPVSRIIEEAVEKI